MQPVWHLLVVVAAFAAATSASGPGLSCGNDWQPGICLEATTEFSFSDGCNTFTCDGRGQYLTTLMACPEANTEAEKRQCRYLRAQVLAQLDASLNLACPELSMEAVCATGANGFTYSDGCNTVSCNGEGNGVTTLMWCPGPNTAIQLAACSRRTDRLVQRLESRTCQGINSTAVCLAEGVGFKFSDGCNTIECGRDGGWTSTLMLCPAAKIDSAICRWVLRKVGRRHLTRGAASSSSAGREFACPSLAIARVCTAKTVGFRYNDGCNDVHCVSPGNAVSTFRLCVTAEANDTEADAYCQRAEAAMEDLRSKSTTRYRCLTATDVCMTDGEQKSFYDGCNYCFCISRGKAGCTRRACHPYFSTKEDFQVECSRRKAGIIN